MSEPVFRRGYIRPPLPMAQFMKEFGKWRQPLTGEKFGPAHMTKPLCEVSAEANAVLQEVMTEAKMVIQPVPARSSYANALSECPRKFLFSVRMGLRLKGSWQGAMETGTIYHLMCRAAGAGKDSEQSLIAASHYVTDRQAELEGMMDDTGLLPNATPIERVMAEMERNFQTARMMFELSYEVFHLSDLLSSGRWERLFVEVPFEVKIKSLTAPIRCKPDLVLIHTETGRLCSLNYKTTGLKPSVLAATYPFALQPRIEKLCLGSNLPDNGVSHYIHCITQRCTLKFPAKKYPTFDDYLAACRKWYGTKREEDPSSPPIYMSSMAYPPNEQSHIPDEETFVRLYELCRACSCQPDGARFYRRESACFGPFHNSPCHFLPLCSQGIETWANLLERRYEQHFRDDDEDETPWTGAGGEAVQGESA